MPVSLAARPRAFPLVLVAQLLACASPSTPGPDEDQSNPDALPTTPGAVVTGGAGASAGPAPSGGSPGGSRGASVDARATHDTHLAGSPALPDAGPGADASGREVAAAIDLAPPTDRPAHSPLPPADPAVTAAFWRTLVTQGESLFFVKPSDAEPPAANLLFVPQQMPTLRSATLQITYEAGKDFSWQPGSRQVTLLPGSRVPSKRLAELYPPKGAPQSIGTSADGKSNLFWAEGRVFHDLQAVATYTPTGMGPAWAAPRQARSELALTISRLQTRRPVRLVVLGDSISQGYNASAFVGAEPRQAPYAGLVAAGLRAAFGGEVTLSNLSVSGKTSDWGRGMATSVADKGADLVLIAFGMNDAAGTSAGAFAANVRTMLTTVRAKNPDCEFILVAGMTGNADWSALRPSLFPAYRDELAKLAGPGVAVADVTTLWQRLLQTKRYHDLSGNGVNHPNDFGHRLYARVILHLLTDGQGL
jgi:lysophospholipase L1-like esterase